MLFVLIADWENASTTLSSLKATFTKGLVMVRAFFVGRVDDDSKHDSSTDTHN